MKQKHLELKKPSLFKSMVLVFVLNKKTWGLNTLASADCCHPRELSGIQQFVAAEEMVPWLIKKGPKYWSDS